MSAATGDPLYPRTCLGSDELIERLQAGNKQAGLADHSTDHNTCIFVRDFIPSSVFYSYFLPLFTPMKKNVEIIISSIRDEIRYLRCSSTGSVP